MQTHWHRILLFDWNFSIEEVPNDDITTSLSVFVTGIAKLNNDVNGYVFSIIPLSFICFIKYYFNHKDNG